MRKKIGIKDDSGYMYIALLLKDVQEQRCRVANSMECWSDTRLCVNIGFPIVSLAKVNF